VAVSKPLFTIFAAITVPNLKNDLTSPHYGTLEYLAEGFLLFTRDLASKNFQSYYLTVADCTSRDANRVCQACQSGLVRNNLMPDNNCVLASDYTGYVADTVNLLLSQCSGNPAAPVGVGCRATDCSGAGTTTACTTCDVANNFYLLNGVCYAYASIPDGYGIVTPGQQILQTCADPNCVKCKDNRTMCTECNSTLGYVLVNGTCHKLTIITTAVKPNKPDVDLSWRQEIADTPIPVNKSKAYKTLIANKKRYNMTVIDASDLVNYSFTIENYDTFVILDFTLPKGLPKEQYNVTLVGFTFNMTEDNGTNYQIQVMNGSTVYYNKMIASELELTDKAAVIVRPLSTTVAAPDSATGLAVMGTLLALDPTGTWYRFTKILQIVNKLYFININYGKRLEAFLAKSAIAVRDGKTREAVVNMDEYRGRLSREKVTLSGISMPLMMYKIIFYVLSWLLRGVKRLLLDNCIMGKVGIYFCHYANKVHLIIFNLVFIDFIWLAPRTLMHSRGLS
jgi:hypothetical protein